jgi:hypothetical protein
MIASWRSHSPRLCFLKDIDQRTGYRSKQMLVAPIVNAQNGELLGVVQLINNRSDTPFPGVADEGIQALAQTLAVAFAQRQKGTPGAETKYDALVSDAILSAAELDLAQRSARRKNIDLEEVLMDGIPGQTAGDRCRAVQVLRLFPMSPSCRSASGRWIC